MARARMIKPEFWEDPKIGKLSRGARLLFIGSWNVSDDDGNVNVEPAFLKSRLFGYDEDVDAGQISRWLEELYELDRLIPYETNGEHYASIRTFTKHQRINNPSSWKNPRPSGDYRGTTVGLPSENESEYKDELKDNLKIKPQFRKGLRNVLEASERELKAGISRALELGIERVPGSPSERDKWQRAVNELLEMEVDPAEEAVAKKPQIASRG